MDVEGLLVDFYNGMHVLGIVAAWSEAEADPQAVLDRMRLFEAAYERLVELSTAGKLGVGAADFSAGNLDLVRRINRLIVPELGRGEARPAVREVRELAERCLQALTPSEGAGATGSAEEPR
jgi:hypothetical protein